MKSTYLIDLARAGPRTGRKAQQLSFLLRRGFPVPPGFCCTFEACDAYSRNDPGLIPALRTELAARIDPSLSYAVRSSGSVEDRLEGSFAGQFASLLDVQGLDAVLDAIVTVWESARSETVRTYARKLAHGEETIQMGVVIQHMIQAAFSGVAFSRNPMTGLQEVVVEAVHGQGTALVQQGVTPERWVNKWGGWSIRPASPTIPEHLIRDVVEGTRQIERACGKPVDLEWVSDGHRVLWLQMREITSLGNLPIYSERMTREMLPGLIKPLIWSVNIPLVNGVWITILTELIGKNSLSPDSLARQFYYRAYFNMGVLGDIFALLGMPRESLELLMGIEVEGATKPRFSPTCKTLRHVPRLIRFVWHAWWIQPEVERFVAQQRPLYEPFLEQPIEELSYKDILSSIDRLFVLNQKTTYYNIIAPLLMQMYHRSLKGILRSAGTDYEQLDMHVDGLEDFDPNNALARAYGEYLRLDETLRPLVRSASYGQLLQMPGMEGFTRQINALLKRFGHLSTIGVDFSAVPWRETPDLVLHMVTSFTSPTPAKKKKIRFEELPLTGIRRRWARLLWERARRFLLFRAQVGELYTFGYGLFRRYFLGLGDHLVRRGLLETAGDVFYLTHQELRSLSDTAPPPSPSPPATLVSQRKQEMERSRDAVVPEVIYGDVAPPLNQEAVICLRGIPTSRGYCAGPVRVIRELREYDTMQDGDVLVIPFSDVGLTPLFARAGAVVAESGGLLSHSSIVAREYGIPAVVSVPGACRLDNGTIVAVDGFTGEIRILSAPEKG